MAGGQPADDVGPHGRRRRITRQRNAIVQVFADCRDFVSAQDFHALLARSGVRVGLTTVCRALRELESNGRADVVRDGTGERRYRPRPGGWHRHYLICRCRGRRRQVESDVVEEWAYRMGPDHGFIAVEHTVELTGICPHCHPHIDGGEPTCRPTPGHRS